MTIRVRPARPGDEAAVAAMAATLARQEGDPDDIFTAAVVARDFLGADPAGLMLVAEALDSALVGYVTGHATYESGYAERGWYVGDLFVAEGHRRQGVGRALMAALAAAARRAGARHLWLTALPPNQAAHAFYRRLGGTGQPLLGFGCTGDDFERLAAEAGPP